MASIAALYSVQCHHVVCAVVDMHRACGTVVLQHCCGTTTSHPASANALEGLQRAVLIPHGRGLVCLPLGFAKMLLTF
jgi:hypothetical protein